MKSIEEIKEIIRYMRKKQEEINKNRTFKPYLYISCGLEILEGYILEINAFQFDLRSFVYTGRDLRDGIMKTGTFKRGDEEE